MTCLFEGNYISFAVLDSTREGNVSSRVCHSVHKGCLFRESLGQAESRQGQPDSPPPQITAIGLGICGQYCLVMSMGVNEWYYSQDVPCIDSEKCQGVFSRDMHKDGEDQNKKLPQIELAQSVEWWPRGAGFNEPSTSWSSLYWLC